MFAVWRLRIVHFCHDQDEHDNKTRSNGVQQRTWACTCMCHQLGYQSDRCWLIRRTNCAPIQENNLLDPIQTNKFKRSRLNGPQELCCDQMSWKLFWPQVILARCSSSAMSFLMIEQPIGFQCRWELKPFNTRCAQSRSLGTNSM